MTRRTVFLLLWAMVCLAGVPAFAQEQPASDPPAHISVVDGSAVLERDGRIDNEPASMPLLAGDRVRTQGGRVEVLFGDGSALHLDANTVVDFQSDDVVRLLDGRVRLSIAGPARDVSYRVDAPSAWVQINTPGEYRVTIVREAEVELAVLRGAAELVNEQGRSYIRAGERTFARAGAAPSPPYVFNSAAWDDFDRWSEARRDRRLGVSAQYLPSEVRPYAASLDAYGDWRHESVHGYVWYPRVHVGWRPYHRGRWVSYRPYGWTWIAGDPWGWPTHHYGRWGFTSGSWFWIPGRHWGPAWVSWAYATDYVSWCPLGWNNRPVLQIVNVNVYGGRRYSPWDAWTVVPRGHFGRGYVNVATASSIRIDQRIHNTFIVRDSAPAVGTAVARSGAPIRSAGRFAVPRSGGQGASTLDTVRGNLRAGTEGRSGGGSERRFPAAARPSGTPSAPITQQGVRAPGDRAIARDRSAQQEPAVSRGGVASQTRGLEAPEYRRAPEGSRRRSAENDAQGAVTSAPPGAVRAVPRVRQPADAAPVDPREGSTERTRVREERATQYSAPSSAPLARPSGETQRYRTPGYRSAPDTGAEYRRAEPRNEAPQYSVPSYTPPPRPSGETERYRSTPGYRSAPDSGAEYRRAEPRNDAPPPSYRSAPERRGPSGPPPAAAPSPRSSGEGDRPAQAGPSRRPSGEAAPSGQAVRRRR